MAAMGRMAVVLGALAAAACVTVNVYFPAAAAEQAADRIIREVYGARKPEAGTAPETAPVPEAAPEGEPGAMRWLDWAIPAAYAQADLNVSTPAIRRLTASMEARHAQLAPYYASGAIGMGRDGRLVIRDLSAVPLPQRGRLKQLVAAENRDRDALYAEIARANGHPEWEADIRSTFARRFVANAPAGWWFQDETGAWRRK